MRKDDAVVSSRLSAFSLVEMVAFFRNYPVFECTHI